LEPLSITATFDPFLLLLLLHPQKICSNKNAISVIFFKFFFSKILRSNQIFTSIFIKT